MTRVGAGYGCYLWPKLAPRCKGGFVTIRRDYCGALQVLLTKVVLLIPLQPCITLAINPQSILKFKVKFPLSLSRIERTFPRIIQTIRTLHHRTSYTRIVTVLARWRVPGYTLVADRIARCPRNESDHMLQLNLLLVLAAQGPFLGGLSDLITHGGPEVGTPTPRLHTRILCSVIRAQT